MSFPHPSSFPSTSFPSPFPPSGEERGGGSERDSVVSEGEVEMNELLREALEEEGEVEEVEDTDLLIKSHEGLQGARMIGRPVSQELGALPPPNKGPSSKSSDLKALINSILCFVGSGVLGLPYALNRVGLLPGLLILWGVAGISLHCMLVVADCQEEIKRRGGKADTYGEVAYYALGRRGAVLVDGCIVLTQCGFCIAYLVFISHNLHDLHQGLSIGAYVALCMPVLVVVCWVKHLKLLAPFSLLAEISVGVALCSVFLFDFEELAARGGALRTIHDLSSLSLSSLPFFFGVSVYCYEGVAMVLPIKNSMNSPSNFKRIWMLSLVLVTFLYSVFGALGELAFGDACLDIITKNLPKDSFLAVNVKVFLCLGLYLTFPLMIFPVFELLEKSMENSRACIRVGGGVKHFGVRTFLVLLVGLLAACVPNFGVFISLVGASASASLAFIFPSLFHLKLNKNLKKTEVLRDCFCLLVGLVGGAIGTTHALKDAFS